MVYEHELSSTVLLPPLVSHFIVDCVSLDDQEPARKGVQPGDRSSQIVVQVVAMAIACQACIPSIMRPIALTAWIGQPLQRTCPTPVQPQSARQIQASWTHDSEAACCSFLLML